MEMVFSNKITIIGIMFRNKVVTERATHLIVNNHNIVIIYNHLRIITTLYLWFINRNFNNNSVLMLAE